jgi:LPXTG-site transpeptidase (sortase) family protein
VLAVLVALVVGVAGGTVAASAGGTVELPPAGDPGALGAAVAEAATPDLDPLGEAAAGLLAELRAVLPEPEQVPLDPRAPTPAVVHGMLEIPSIGLAQPLHEGVTLTAIDRGPSHWPGTAMPGELGNVVVAGHRTTYTRPFWDLDLVQPGDELIFAMNDGTRHVYAATDIEVVDANAIHIIDQGIGHTATLFACHPKGSARQRIVGHFELVESVPPA